MPREGAIKVEGLVVEALSNETYRVQLANGHRVLGFVPRKTRPKVIRWNPGDKVMLEMSPYDLSEGRIVIEERFKT